MNAKASDDKHAEAKPQGPIRRAVTAVATAPGRFLRLSLAARASIATAFFLVVLVAVAWTALLVNPASVPWRHSMTLGRVLAVLALAAVIPWVVYRGLKLWFEGESSRFSDIDYAWKAGLAALARNNIRIDATPLFLILGSTDERQEAAIADAAGLAWRVRGAPDGPAPLRWFANADGIYLFCTTSWLAALVDFQRRKATATAAAAIGNLEAPAGAALPQLPADFEASMPAPIEDVPAQPQPARSRGSASPRGTMMLDPQMQAALAAGQAPPARETAGGAQPSAAASGRPPERRGTMMLQAARVDEPSPIETPTAAAPRATPRLSPHDTAEQVARLQYVCELVRRARQPLCGVNGVLTLLPFALVQTVGRDADELQQAVRTDLATVQETLALRSPVNVLITGLDDEPGFRELVRRVGRDRAAVQRFGRGFDVRVPATSEELTAFCVHVCGAFEDWVYALFREKDALSRPGNLGLFGLLCKVRSSLKARLADFLAGAFGHDSQAADGEHVMFAGCYFAATGESEDRQAFVRAVFEKMAESQEDVEWTRQAVAAESRYQALAVLGVLVSAALVVAAAVLVVRRLLL